MHSLRRTGHWPPLLLIATLVVLAYAPVLFGSRTQIHGEGVTLGMALLQILSAALHGDHGALWTNAIYGGHPVFAEGQGGFAHPLHLAVAWLLPPVRAYNVLQVLGALLAGAGAYGMCRSAGCGRAAGVFGSLALIFSTLWISGRSNLAIGSTMACIPWALWAMASWLRRADLPSACAFGGVIALMVLSGYPQLVHGVIVYVAVYLLVQLLSSEGRRSLQARLRPLAGTLALAVLLCVGLAAVQWLPLLELAAESHRSGGIAIGGLDGAPPVTIFRGFLFSIPSALDSRNGFSNSGLIDFPGMGSLVVCLTASLCLLFRIDRLVAGHLLASLLLVVLSLGSRGTPLFDLLYDYHLLPGLHSFRVTFVYLYVALPGLSLVAAVTLERLGGGLTDAATVPERSPPGAHWHRLAVLGWLLAWGVVLACLHHAAVPPGQYVLATGWLLLCSAALRWRRRQWLPVAAVLLLCVDILAYRLDAIDYGDAGLIARPQSLAALQQRGELRDYRVADRSNAVNYSFLDSKSPLVTWGVRKMLASLTPAANALWGVASLQGNLALQLRRRSLADPLILRELSRGDRSPPGLRLIDFLGLRYVSVAPAFSKPGFPEVYADPELDVRFLENGAALPRFQFFDDAVFVPDADTATAVLGGLRQRVLVIEADPPPELQSGVRSPAAPGFALVLDRPDKYRFDVSSGRATWFFLADTNYPGWKAYLDGEETPVYSAQLLGKAVHIPPGRHRLTVVFESASFRLGLGITLATAVLAVLLLAGTAQRRNR